MAKLVKKLLCINALLDGLNDPSVTKEALASGPLQLKELRQEPQEAEHRVCHVLDTQCTVLGTHSPSGKRESFPSNSVDRLRVKG